MIVQLAPEARTELEEQVPPVMENVPPVVVSVAVGAAVNVNAPAVVPVAVFVTVIVPDLVLVLAGVVVSAGVGAEIVSVAPMIWNAPVRVAFPVLVATVTFLRVSPAVEAITHEALTVVAVGVPLSVQVTPAPLMVTSVVPARLVPVIVTGTVVPRTPLVGDMLVRVGAPPTVNAAVRVAFPSGEATVTFLAVSAAAAVITQEALTVVPVGVPLSVQVIPVPLMVTPVESCRPAPVKVTGTVVPLAPDVGLIDVRDGPSTVNAPAAVTVPPPVVMVTFRAVKPAVCAMVKVAVMVVELIACALETVTPAPETVTVCRALKFAPVMVTLTAVPR